ncbi:hypothetical protein CRG98_003696 [Punica granatum]|uniref:Uncharacterized protein n=1 Tax=Punica granatum TaxID=22663 RepID=A0A2I0L5L6_PUNGR|nr:hypothetical protein CRG98_003696 [Punica granatum]
MAVDSLREPKPLYFERNGDSRLDPIPHSGCAHSVCEGVLDLVFGDLGCWTLYGPECGLSPGPASHAFGSRGLGVSTSPWGRVTNTRERRSRHLSFYDPKVEGG